MSGLPNSRQRFELMEGRRRGQGPFERGRPLTPRIGVRDALAAKGLRDVILLTLGTGVGGAAMVDGRLLSGHIGRAGHLGHICLDRHGPIGITGLPGTLEYHIGNYSIRERSAGRFQNTHDLILAHTTGDPEATRIWQDSVDALGCAIASFINILDPEAVIIGGGIARAGEVLFSPLRQVLDRIEWRPGGRRVKVLPAGLGEFAGALGIASQALKLAGGTAGKPVNNL